MNPLCARNTCNSLRLAYTHPTMIKVLATDLDGTLFYPKKTIRLVDSANKELIRDFVHSGGKVVMVSSRAEPFLEKVKAKVGVPMDYIGCDGSVINVGGTNVLDRVFDPEGLRKLLASIRQDYDPGLILLATKEHPVIMTQTRVSHTTNILYFIYEAMQGAYREPWIRSDHFFYGQLAKGEVRKVMLLIGITKKKQLLAEKITETLIKRYPEFEFTWLNQFIEITPKGCSKASGVSFYLDYLGISHDNVVVVGDSGNDVPMFRAFHDNSYCMSHSRDSVKTEAAHVIKRVSDLRPVLCPSVDSIPSEKEEG